MSGWVFHSASASATLHRIASDCIAFCIKNKEACAYMRLAIFDAGPGEKAWSIIKPSPKPSRLNKEPAVTRN